jgi:hypothetical protein
LTNSGNELLGLFEVHEAPSRRRLPSFAVSTTLHGVGIALISYTLLHAPHIVQDPASRQYKVRHLDFHVPETAASRTAEALYPKENPAPVAEKKQEVRPAAEGGHTETAQAEPRPRAVPALKLPEGGKGKQILVQPQIQSHEALAEETPIPAAIIWTPELKPVLKIVPPTPDAVTTASVQTSLQLPNEELALADLAATAAKNPPRVPTPPAANTSPVASKGSSAVTMPPVTVSKSNDQPTPTAVLSVSDLRMKEGTAVLPPVNETRGTAQIDGAATSAGALLAANPAATPAGGTRGTSAGGGGKGSTAAPPAAGTMVADAQKASQNESAAGESATHIQLPKDGKFGVVVVGSTLADQYPETLQIWSDRMAYTVYLHIGTPKAWILQYAQIRSADEAAAGAVAKLEAPWPYDIERPDLLARDLNADALMVRGVLNTSGRLEKLSIAYPQGYVHSSFVLRELAQWQFRPARQLDKPATVEVLLIIPEEEAD